MMLNPIVLALILQTRAQACSLHLQIDGAGFLRFSRLGKPVYVSDATLVIRDGLITNRFGWPLLPQIHVPAGTDGLSATIDGQIYAKLAAGTVNVGRVVLSLFPSSIKPSGYFMTRLKSTISSPGDGLAGVVRTIGGAAPVQPSREAAKPFSTPDVQGSVSGAALSGRGLTIEIAPESVVDHVDLTLGDIGKFTGPPDVVAKLKAVKLGPLPSCGVPARFPQGYLLAKIRSVGLLPSEFKATIPDECQIEKVFQTVPVDVLVSEAIDAVHGQLGVSVSLAQTSKIEAMKLDQGKLTFETEVKRPSSRSVDVEVFGVVDGQRMGSRVLTMVPDDASTVVSPGDSVSIRLISHGATVEVSGQAMTGGWSGQKVTVKSCLGTTHTGVIAGPGVVEVRL